MYWLDFAIIYFALGAPFGVLRITAKRKATPFAYLRMTSGYLLWPLVAIRNVARFLAEARTSVRASTLNASTSHNASERQVNQDIDSLRTELERALFPNARAFPESESRSRDIYAFREVFYRYTGLAQSIAEFRMQIAEWSDSNSTFDIRHSTLVRSACIARRDRQKLNVHFTTARKDFVEALGEGNITEIDRTVEALAQCIGDKTLISAIYSR